MECWRVLLGKLMEEVFDSCEFLILSGCAMFWGKKFRISRVQVLVGLES